jgi:hypothetical protein
MKFYGTRTHGLYDYSNIEPGSNWRPHPCKGCMIDNHDTKEQQNDFSVPQKSSFLTLVLKFWAAEFCVHQVSLPRNGSEQNSDSLLLYFFHGTEFRVVFSSAEGFGREFWEYASIFGSTERNSKLFSLPLKCSEGNSESSLLFLFNGTEFRVVFSSAEGFGTEFRGFLFRGTAKIVLEITICSVYAVFRGIIFLSEIPNPSSVKLHFFCGIPFRSVLLRASELALPHNSECLGMSTFFRRITEIIPSLFRGIFSERNSVPNPSQSPNF